MIVLHSIIHADKNLSTMPMSPVRRDTSGAEVTLAEVLGARQSAFGESDLWSVLYAACQSLEDYLTRGKSGSYMHRKAVECLSLKSEMSTYYDGV